MDHDIDATITPTRYTSWRTRPDPEAVERAASLLARARNPAIICGDGIAASGAQQELVRLVELVGARAYTGIRGEVNIPTDHPQYLGGFTVSNAQDAVKLLADADVIFCVGMPVLTLLLYTDRALPQGIPLIHLDINPWEIGKNYQPDVGCWETPNMAWKRSRQPRRVSRLPRSNELSGSGPWPSLKRRSGRRPLLGASPPRLGRNTYLALPTDGRAEGGYATWHNHRW